MSTQFPSPANSHLNTTKPKPRFAFPIKEEDGESDSGCDYEDDEAGNPLKFIRCNDHQTKRKARQ